jgi:cobalt-zinc-cadmium efflux system membrane fusion protein
MESGIRLRWPVLVLSALVLLGAGAGGAYLWIHRPAGEAAGASTIVTDATRPSQPAPDQTSQALTSAPLGDVAVQLTEEAVTRAGIEVAPVEARSGSDQIRVPGSVQPNTYRSVVVTPIVGGRLTSVRVELGQRVRAGQILAELHSPELAEAQARFLSLRAELEAHEQALRRTEKLAGIGAASRQELEKIHAEHTAATTMVGSQRARLQLLGMTDDEVGKLGTGAAVSATIRVPAPRDGVVTRRDVNPGQNVDPSMPLFQIVDLSNVWVIGDLYERDFASVRVGSAATVTTTAYPELKVAGKVTYIDPQVKPETRTAQLRVEVPNPKGELRLGMYAEIQLGVRDGASTPVVPKSAIQTVGDRTVVYLADGKQPARFIEREVRLGEPTGDAIHVLSGLQPGDIVVTKGSFALRAERDRLGFRPLSGVAGSQPVATDSATKTAGEQTARILVNDQGYEPASVSLRANVPARLTFLRTSDKTCGTEVTIPSLAIARKLPLNLPVDVTFTPAKTGNVDFVCGMNMLRGTIVVK